MLGVDSNLVHFIQTTKHTKRHEKINLLYFVSFRVFRGYKHFVLPLLAHFRTKLKKANIE